MELRQLRDFLTVIDCGTLGDAARRLKVTQPTLTKSIQSLERSLGTMLFVRSKQGMAPTVFGRSLEIRARVISAEFDRARDEIGELAEVRRGKIAIGTGPTFARKVLPTALNRFLRIHPRVEVEVVEGFIDDLLPAIKTGRLEYILFTLSPRSQDPDLMSEVLLPGQATVIASTRDPIASQRKITPQQLLSYKWLLPRLSDQLRERLNMFFRRLDLPAPEPAIEFNSILLAKELLCEGGYLSYLPELLVSEEIKQGLLRALTIPGLTWKRSVGAISRRDIPLTPAARTLLEHIRSVCTEMRGAAGK